MIVSQRERVLAVTTLVVLLYAALLMFYKRQKAEIDRIRLERSGREARYAEYCRLIAQNQTWSEAYAKDAGLMPVFEPERKVETYWLGVLDRLATTNGLSIIRRQVGEERLVDPFSGQSVPLNSPSRPQTGEGQQEGSVYELAIECKEWEGSLDSLVKFLYDVHAEGAMLDVRKLFIRPAAGGGKSTAGLRGSFTRFCAFLRAEKGAEEADSR